jgi:hypothetical protein
MTAPPDSTADQHWTRESCAAEQSLFFAPSTELTRGATKPRGRQQHMAQVIDLDEFKSRKIAELQGIEIRELTDVCPHVNYARFVYPTHEACRCLDCGRCWETLRVPS